MALSSKHIMTMDDLTPEDIALILDTAESFAEVNQRRINSLAAAITLSLVATGA